MDLVLVNLTLAAFMAGVGWLVELLVYPQLAGVAADRWAAYHRAHCTRITPVVAPPLLAAPLVAAALALAPPPGAPGALLAANSSSPPRCSRRPASCSGRCTRGWAPATTRPRCAG